MTELRASQPREGNTDNSGNDEAGAERRDGHDRNGNHEAIPAIVGMTMTTMSTIPISVGRDCGCSWTGDEGAR